MNLPRQPQKGFSLVELLVAMTILSAMLLMFVGLLDQTRLSWEYASSKVSQFREARTAFDMITKNLGQATLNAYYDQIDEDRNAVPDDYKITSELHFKVMPAKDLPISGDKPGHAIFFQAPLGVVDDPRLNNLTGLLNPRGYFVQFNSDKEYKPPFISASYEDRMRYRLMEFLPPTEQNLVYIDHQEDIEKRWDELKFNRWYREAGHLNSYSRPLAENILAIVFSPREPVANVTRSANMDQRRAVERIAPYYSFDSEQGEEGSSVKRFRHVLPPLVKVTMIAIDEKSAIRLDEINKESPYMNDFVGQNWMRNAGAYDADIQLFIDKVNDMNRDDSNGLKVNYKIFSTTVSILASKWSPDGNL